MHTATQAVSPIGLSVCLSVCSPSLLSDFMSWNIFSHWNIFQSLKYFSIIEIFSIMKYLNHCGVWSMISRDILRYLCRYPEISWDINHEIFQTVEKWFITTIFLLSEIFEPLRCYHLNGSRRTERYLLGQCYLCKIWNIFNHWNIFQSLKYFQSWDIWTIVVWSMISWDIWTNEVWSMISQDILRLILIYV